MSKVIRFIWVRGPSGHRLHIKYGNTSEGPTKCGIPAGKGWRWVVRRETKTKTCARCVA